MSLSRLLILDDDLDICLTIKAIAERAGVTALIATDPESFFDQVVSWRPTHIALDLIMPEMDGVEVLSRLSDLNCGASIIITSGIDFRVLDAARRSAHEHGLQVSGVLQKPFSPAQLRELLQADGSAGAAGPHRSASAFQPTAANLAAAMREGQIRLAYQPKVHCGSGALSGFEALARWEHPEHGTILPERFVPVAEAHGLIDQLTLSVLEQVLHWMRSNLLAEDRTWPIPVESPLTVAVNISARTLEDKNFAEAVVGLCEQYGIGHEHVVFELTETSAMADPTGSLDLLTRLRLKGFQLSIDDFGTGFSSMKQLVRLPFSELKVDKSFVLTALASDESRAVVRSVIDLGHSLGLKTVAEGVEDQQTLTLLRECGCDLAQGHFIAPPMLPAEVPEWMADYARGLP
jgi:EAL domain-containing protein (putative c-di-GMP-specific phosphodiesterase class I)